MQTFRKKGRGILYEELYAVFPFYGSRKVVDAVSEVRIAAYDEEVPEGSRIRISKQDRCTQRRLEESQCKSLP